VFADASEFCRRQGTSISQLALQFASQHPDIPTTMFSSANPESVRRNIAWHEEQYDPQLLAEVQARLRPVMNKQWSY
jgi:aryl-alcohol dehydrogenase-like predicted oxidoreductase